MYGLLTSDEKQQILIKETSIMNTETLNTETNSTVLEPFVAVILQEVPVDNKEPNETGTGTGTGIVNGTSDSDVD